MNKLPKIIIAALCCLFFSSDIFSQISKGGTPASFNINLKSATTALPTERMPQIDVAALYREDSLEADKAIPFRFGKPFDVEYDIYSHGVWETLKDGSKIWRLRIESPGAFSINLLYDEFQLPAGAQFYLYNEDRSMVIGAFTSENNKPDGMFATQPVAGDVCILELNIPASVNYPGRISISRVVHGYKDIFAISKSIFDYGDSGPCNINVICPEGVGWEDEVRAVAMSITSGGFRLCTGTLINNARHELKPYFLTANHCLGGSNGWIFMFNYESAQCELESDGPTTMTISGSQLIANYGYSDFALLLLNEDPPESFNAHLAGWSNIDVPASSSTTIHHPQGDIKKISINNNPVTSTDVETSTGDSHWKVDFWNDGTTEGGSSGAPLFDQNHRIVGQLHGGFASCDEPLESDWYGKFAKSWDVGGIPSRRLKDWLDPDASNATSLEGVDFNILRFTHGNTIGSVPFDVSFEATSNAATVDSWDWSFGDGGVSSTPSDVHTYNTPGVFDVSVEIESSGQSYLKEKSGLVIALADTLIGADVNGEINESVELIISATNNIPLKELIIPIEYNGPVPLVFDSISTAGCRTDYFDVVALSHILTSSKQRTYTLKPDNSGTKPPLPSGSGPILKIYLTIENTATPLETTPINFGYLVYLPAFFGETIVYEPKISNGSISVNESCCVGDRGNINNDEFDEVAVDDLVYLVNYIFYHPESPAPECMLETDVDGSGGVDISDVVYFVNYIFRDPSGPAPVSCF